MKLRSHLPNALTGKENLIWELCSELALNRENSAQTMADIKRVNGLFFGQQISQKRQRHQ
ncbi:MAG: hypothetical protein KME21_12000 [Desmonostoc vinosum HA7617-LM4]|nr:hypothetical protein [Desmonostoc vinosum HA7617-LM4]